MLENNHQGQGRAFREFNEENGEEQNNIEQSSADNAQINTHQKINKSQKIAVIFLAFFAVFVIILWFVSFQNSIRSPFEYKGVANVSQNMNEQSANNSQTERLKSQDTDKDGLTDWDELNFYQTSPYLEDSDSDGFSDKQEIDSDNDPNCPQGVDCYSSGLTNEKKTAESENINNSAVANSPEQPSNSNSSIQSNGLDQTRIEAILGGKPDAQTLRKLLIEYGMDENILNQFSDEELIKNWQETMQAQEAQ